MTTIVPRGQVPIERFLHYSAYFPKNDEYSDVKKLPQYPSITGLHDQVAVRLEAFNDTLESIAKMVCTAVAFAFAKGMEKIFSGSWNSKIWKEGMTIHYASARFCAMAVYSPNVVVQGVKNYPWVKVKKNQTVQLQWGTDFREPKNVSWYQKIRPMGPFHV